MHSTRLALLLVSAMLGGAIVRAVESAPPTPEAAAPPQTSPATQAANEAATPFWLAPKINPGLAPAAVTLVSPPDPKVSFDRLEIGDINPRTFVVTNPAVIPFVSGADTGYDIVPGGLKIGSLAYADRKYTIQKLPPVLSGLPLLRTRSADKAIIDARFAIVVTAPRPCYVMVALDERALATYKQYGAPGWLQEFAPTDHKIETDDPLMAAQNLGFLVFARKAPAGRIALGPPCMDIKFNAMYFAFFSEDP